VVEYIDSYFDPNIIMQENFYMTYS